jgi:sugar lactone lactonase YvrE
MKGKVILTTVTLLVATSVFAGTLNIVGSFQSQKYWRKGLEYANGYLYATSNYNDNTIHVYTTNGILVRTIPTPPGAVGLEVSHAPSGHLWLSTFSPGYGYLMRLSNGSIVSSFPGPARGQGITSDGRFLYWSTTYAERVYVLTTTGSVVRYFTQPPRHPGGCDYVAPGYLWLCDWYLFAERIYYCTTRGSLVDSFRTPGAPRIRPSGVTWDGNYVWYHHYKYELQEPAYVYRARVTFSGTGVEPASVGRVKALFR